MIIRTVSQADFSVWDRYVANHQESVPYQLGAWGRACLESYKHPLFYLQAEHEGQIVGVLPLVYIKAPFMRGELVSMPFCDTGGIICDSLDVYNALMDEAIRLGRNLGVAHIEIRAFESTRFLDERSDAVRMPSNKVTMILKLPDTSEELLAGFKSKLRSQIRKADKNGLEFKWVGEDNLDHFFSIYAVNMKILGSPIHSQEWFLSLSKCFGESLRIGVVYYGDEPVGAGIIMSHGNTVAIPWASTIRDYNHLAPNMLLYWKLLMFACDSGFSYFDFGRATKGEGTYKFKEQWGAEPHALCWFRIGVKDEVDNSSFDVVNKSGLAVRVWKKLPQSLADYLGPKVRKYISL